MRTISQNDVTCMEFLIMEELHPYSPTGYVTVSNLMIPAHVYSDSLECEFFRELTGYPLQYMYS